MQTHDDIIAAYIAGKSIDAIRREMKLSRSVVRSAIVSAGIDIRSSGRQASLSLSNAERNRRRKQLEKNRSASRREKMTQRVYFLCDDAVFAELKAMSNRRGVSVRAYCRNAVLRRLRADRQSKKSGA